MSLETLCLYSVVYTHRTNAIRHVKEKNYDNYRRLYHYIYHKFILFYDKGMICFLEDHKDILTTFYENPISIR